MWSSFGEAWFIGFSCYFDFFAGNLACWISLRSTGAQLNPSKINTVMICCSGITAGGPFPCPGRNQKILLMFFIAKARAADRCFFLLDHCKINSVLSFQKGLPWGKLQRSTPWSIPFIACFFFFFSVYFTYLFSQWSHWWIHKVIILSGYANHSCKLASTGIIISLWLQPYHSLTLHFITYSIQSGITSSLRKRPKQTSFILLFKDQTRSLWSFQEIGCLHSNNAIHLWQAKCFHLSFPPSLLQSWSTFVGLTISDCCCCFSGHTVVPKFRKGHEDHLARL